MQYVFTNLADIAGSSGGQLQIRSVQFQEETAINMTTLLQGLRSFTFEYIDILLDLVRSVI